METPAYDILPIEPSDDDNIQVPKPEGEEDEMMDVEVRGLRVSGEGNVKILTRAGEERTLAFLAGETRWVYTKKVFETDTTASGIEGIV